MDLQRWRPREGADERPDARRHHVVLGNQQRNLLGTTVLENNNNNFNAADQNTDEINLPVAVTVFPGEIYRAPRSWTERAYSNLIYDHAVDKGGHFAAWEQPQLFAEEMRSAFRTLR